MRRATILALLVLAGLAIATRAWAVVSHEANITKENGYAILTPPPAKAIITKENGYAILQPPGSKALITKENAYAILRPPGSQALITKETAYAILLPRIPLPSVQILQ